MWSSAPTIWGCSQPKRQGLPLTGFMSFLSQLYEELPVITPVGIITGDGQAGEAGGADRGAAGVADGL